MVNSPGLCFVVASESYARFVRPGPDNRLHTIRSVGRATGWNISGQTNCASGSRDPSDHVSLSGLLAGRISEDFAVDMYIELVLVGPPTILQEILDLIDVPEDAAVIGTLEADLVTLSDEALGTRLRSWLWSERDTLTLFDRPDV